MKNKKKKLLFLSLLPAALIFSLILRHTCISTDSKKFHNFAEDLFVNQLSQDSLSLHYTLAAPEAFHIPSTPVTLPVYQKNKTFFQHVFYENAMEQLNSIQPEKLSDSDAVTYHLLSDSLKEGIKGLSYPFYSEPLSPNSGMQSQLPILLAEYYFDDKEDIAQYLALLSCIPAYFNGLSAYEAEKAQQGLVMPAYSLEKVIAQCHSIIEESAVRNNSHFLVQTFRERVSALEKKQLITSKEAALFEKQNQEVLLTAVIPAYHALADSLEPLKAFSKNQSGIGHFPKGREYYAYLLKQTTGSSKTIPEIKALLAERMRLDYEKLAALRKNLILEVPASPVLSFSSPEAMLLDLKKRTADSFPPLPGDFSFSIKSVSPALAPYVSPAFYLTPPIDRLKQNTIYLNHSSITDSIELYTTLAHEGFPGHAYQTLYSNLHGASKKQLPIHALLSYGGFVEGWALYTENKSYDFVMEILKESGASREQLLLVEFERTARDLQLCLYSILDIDIHYDGFSKEEVFSMLAELGVVNENTVSSIYEYIVEEPTNYPKYYLGYLEFLELRELVIKKEGAAFSETAFHQKILEAGPMDFDTLKDCLNPPK